MGSESEPGVEIEVRESRTRKFGPTSGSEGTWSLSVSYRTIYERFGNDNVRFTDLEMMEIEVWTGENVGRSIVIYYKDEKVITSDFRNLTNY